MMDQAFPKQRRLRKRVQFVEVQTYGQRRKREGLLFLLRANGLTQCRLGLNATRRAWPRAVDRNRLRRLLREAFRLDQGGFPPGWDMVVIITKAAAGLTLPTAREAMSWAVKSMDHRQPGQALQ